MKKLVLYLTMFILPLILENNKLFAAAKLGSMLWIRPIAASAGAGPGSAAALAAAGGPAAETDLEEKELNQYLENLKLKKFSEINSTLDPITKKYYNFIFYLYSKKVKQATKDLFTAIKINDFEKTKIAIENDANVNGTKYGYTPLAEIILGVHTNEKINIFNLLIDSGANVNKKINALFLDEETPLMLASRFFWQENIVEILIKAGADVNAKNEYHFTALHRSALSPNEPSNTTKYLIQSHADIEAKNNAGNTPLLCCAQSGNVVAFTNLIEAGANIDERNKYGQTALMIAAIYGKEKIINLLLKQKIDINTKSNEGYTALRYAHSYNQLETARLLTIAGAH